MKRCFATIVSPNYLAYARVLGESLARHCPGDAFRVLVVGEPEPKARDGFQQAGLHATFAPELGLPDFEHLAFKYDLLELNTALKPTFLLSLFSQGFDEVIYLDPDILMYRAPTPVTDALASADIVLIPHALAPAMDGKRPSDIDFLRAGTFNLGFVGLRRSANTMALLAWWERRCLAFGFNDQGFGTFVDQKWMDLAPCYFDSVQVLKHPGCNVAYWNLHEREIEADAGGLRVNGQPLVFFHFSGIDARRPELLSKHQTRHLPQPGSALATMVADYCARLLAAGHAQWKDVPYSYGHLSDGTTITSVMRRAAMLSSLDSAHPFDPGSSLQRALRASGLTRQPAEDFSKATTVNFDGRDRRVRLVNAAVRAASRVIGADRVAALLRYASFLSWQSNYAAALLKQPFELDHRDPRV